MDKSCAPEMELKELTAKIIGCAFNVYNKMGFGFQESVYENAMLIELAKAALSFEAQKPVAVHYEGHRVGEFVAERGKILPRRLPHCAGKVLIGLWCGRGWSHRK